MHHFQYFFRVIFVFFLLVGCDNVPKGVLDRQQMEDVLIDVHMAEAVIDEYPSNYRSISDKQKLMAGVFAKHGVTKADFDSSMVYYSAHLDQYMKIYQKVNDRLSAQQKLLTAEYTGYLRSLLTPEGDSMNIWRKESQAILNPALLVFNQCFEIKGDSNFKKDDRLIWSMRFAHLPADTLAYVYVSLGSGKIGGETTQVTAVPKKDGWLSIELQGSILNSSGYLFGNISLINRKDTFLSPVYIDSITLMRYHYLKPDSISIDSLSTDSLKTDSLRIDSLKVDSPQMYSKKIKL